jgi:uncharacterized protein (DUF1015 family)
LPQIRPFSGIHYARKRSDLSSVIAPPYDVLNEAQKTELLQRDTHNIVAVDLPFLPPKSVGPDEVYAQANAELQAWLEAGVLEREAKPAFYAYAQTFEHAGRSYHRRGFVGLVKLSPFEAGEVLPHERTYQGPIEDRLRLMKHTGMQLSPIFGLFDDPGRQVTGLLYRGLDEPHCTGTLEGVRNDLWIVDDPELERQVIELMRRRPVYIADGHHRYTTALEHREQAQRASGGTLAEEHPANWCMFVLVAMEDEGLLILPTHRLVGGLSGFSAQELRDALGPDAELNESAAPPERIAEFAERLAGAPAHTFGLYDGEARRLHTLRVQHPDILRALEPERSAAWRSLDVAILQRYLLDEVVRPRFAGGRDPAIGYTADPATIPGEVDGRRFQLALLLRPTPLDALRELAGHGEVMPQKSTYFYPKVATGMVLNPLR